MIPGVSATDLPPDSHSSSFETIYQTLMGISVRPGVNITNNLLKVYTHISIGYEVSRSISEESYWKALST